MGELRQVHRLAAQGLLRRRRDGGERLRLPAPAEDHRQPLALPDDAARARRRPRRPLRDGPEPGRRLAALGVAAARARPPQVAGGARPVRARDGDVLARRPEVRSGELRPEDIQTEVFLMPAASHVEKDGHFTNTQRLLQWHDKAMEPPGDARSELWFMHHLLSGCASTTRLRGRPRLADPQPHVGLPRARRDPRARRRGRAARDQRLRHGDGRAGVGLRRAQGRRLDGVRLLDLRRLLRGRRQPDAPPRARRPRRPRRLGVAGVGVGVAGQPPHALQPRLGRPRRASRGRSASATSGGTRPRRSGRATTCRTSRPPSRRTTSRRATPRAWTRSPAPTRSS